MASTKRYVLQPGEWTPVVLDGANVGFYPDTQETVLLNIGNGPPDGSSDALPIAAAQSGAMAAAAFGGLSGTEQFFLMPRSATARNVEVVVISY